MLHAKSHAKRLLAIGATLVARIALAQSADSSQAGAYTEEQATLGAAVFARECLSCHARRDMASPDFQIRWGGLSARALFERVTTTMPEKSPGALAREDYLLVVAYLLKLNGLPAGPAPLTADSASLVRARFAVPPSGHELDQARVTRRSRSPG